VSRLLQEGNGELTLEQTFELPAGLVNPFLITTLFDGEDLMVADADSANLLHPEETELEDEGEVTLPDPPLTLFEVPESGGVLVGQDDGSSLILIEEDGPEILEEAGPPGNFVTGFGYAERIQTVTETTGF
jgi:hypothetical protein